MLRKALVLLAIATVAFAGTADLSMDSRAFSVGAEPGNQHNAHWEIYDDGGEDVIACIKDGGPEHGDNDYTWFYNTTAVDLTQDSNPTLEFDYDIAGTTDTALTVYLCGTEPTDSTTLTAGDNLGTYSGINHAEVALDDTIATAYIAFLWESGTTIGDGPILDNVEVHVAGQSAPIEIWYQDTDQSPSGEAMNFDVSGDAAGENIRFGFLYTTQGGTWAWYWAIDDVVVTDDTRAELFSEDFEAGDPGWDQIQYGGTEGYWELLDTTARPRNGMTGNYYAADSDLNSSYVFDVETFTPWIDCTGSSTVEIDYMSNLQDFNGDGDGTLNLYTMVANYLIDESFDDMNDWTDIDEGTGSSIEDASWGEIKTLD
ncbi:MAG: hypothetical protein GF403_01180 [Candidatus Coatesbacteria bacterium]|nr:hypothetical protein [Candidatus Coatesbacteria bacterium]